MTRKEKIVPAQSSAPTRDDLIEFVRRGQMTTGDAESRAAELSLTPLINSPIENDFDPMAEPYWSVPMALAWIMTRDANSVRGMWDRWRAEKEFWSWSRWQVPGGPINEGYWIKTNGPAGLVDLSVASAIWQTEGKLVISRMDATAELLKALQAGTIEATGIASLGEPRVLIAAYLWRDLDLYESKHQMVARTMNGIGSGFDDVAFDSKIIRAQWQPINTRLKATVSAETDAIAALATELRANNDMRRSDAKKFCMPKYAVSGRGFLNRIWPKARLAAGRWPLANCEPWPKSKANLTHSN